MKNLDCKGKWLKIIRWIARIASSLLAVFFLLSSIGGFISEPEPLTLEGGMIAGFAIILTVAVIIAWFREGVGGVTLVIISLVFAVFVYITAGTNKVMASMTISSPFLISGVLFLIYRYKSVKAGPL